MQDETVEIEQTKPRRLSKEGVSILLREELFHKSTIIERIEHSTIICYLNVQKRLDRRHPKSVGRLYCRLCRTTT